MHQPMFCIWLIAVFLTTTVSSASIKTRRDVADTSDNDVTYDDIPFGFIKHTTWGDERAKQRRRGVACLCADHSIGTSFYFPGCGMKGYERCRGDMGWNTCCAYKGR